MGRQAIVKRIRRNARVFAQFDPGSYDKWLARCIRVVGSRGFRPRTGRRIAELSKHGFEARDQFQLGHMLKPPDVNVSSR